MLHDHALRLSVLDRARGSLLGLAVGDALGAAVEFQSPGSFEPVTGMRAGGALGLEAGEWTDDTSMALAMAASLGEKGFDAHDQAVRYLDWYRTGAYSVNGRCFDVGNATSASIRKFAATGKVFGCASTDEADSGNGSIMRLAPVVIKFGDMLLEPALSLDRMAAMSSRVTHASVLCVDACRYLACLLRALAMTPAGGTPPGDWAESFEPNPRDPAASPLHPLVDGIARGGYLDKRESKIRGSGYVVESLEAALWCFAETGSFEECVLKAVNLGDDADTTGAVAGQIAGAYYGFAAIPQHLKGGLARRDMIDLALAQLGCPS